MIDDDNPIPPAYDSDSAGNIFNVQYNIILYHYFIVTKNHIHDDNICSRFRVRLKFRHKRVFRR